MYQERIAHTVFQTIADNANFTINFPTKAAEDSVIFFPLNHIFLNEN